MRIPRAFDTPEGRVTYEVEVRSAPIGVMEYHFVSQGRLEPVGGGEAIDLSDDELRRMRNRHEQPTTSADASRSGTSRRA
jgi:hypothetical protein